MHDQNKIPHDLLVSREQLRRFVLAYQPYYSQDIICAFVREQDIAPGIVVCHLQNDGHVPFGRCNDMKGAIDWSGTGLM